MTRVTYKILKNVIDNWNEAHADLLITLDVYSGYYHIGYSGPHGSADYFIMEETPSRALECFNIWKNGFYKGQEHIEK